MVHIFLHNNGINTCNINGATSGDKSYTAV